MDNPFTYGEGLPPDRLVDRRDELYKAVRNLESGGRLFMIGPRRFGKTSLLRAAQHQANEAGVPTLRVNAEGHLDLDALAGELIAKSVELFPATAKERLLRTSEWFSALKPTANYDPITDAISVGVTTKQNSAKAYTITEALDAINKLAAKKQTRIGVIIDEFQEISRREGVPAEKLLRAHIQEHGSLSYIFSGSDTTLMSEMVSQYKRPLYRLGSILYHSFLPDEDVEQFLVSGFAKLNCHLPSALALSLIAAARRVPYNIQKLAAALFESLLRNRASRASRASRAINEKDLSEALAAVVREGQPYYFTFFQSLTPRRREVLSALAKESNRSLALATLARQMGLPVSTVRAAKKTFVDGDLLRVAPDVETKEQIEFVDPFFELWLRETYG